MPQINTYIGTQPVAMLAMHLCAQYFKKAGISVNIRVPITSICIGMAHVNQRVLCLLRQELKLH